MAIDIENPGADAAELANALRGAMGARELLTADRTYYVRPDGNDSNNGLANTSGGAFLTIQKAVDTVAYGLDIQKHEVTINVADGTYAPFILPEIVGGTLDDSFDPNVPVPPLVYIVGNPTTPANVLVTRAAVADGKAYCIAASGAASRWWIKGFRFTMTGAGYGLLVAASHSARLWFTDIEVGSTGNDAGYQFYSYSHAAIYLDGTLKISDDPYVVFYSQLGCITNISSAVTLSGTPAWGNAFVQCQQGSDFNFYTSSLTGSATGKRFSLDTSSYIVTIGTDPPGDVAGIVDATSSYNGVIGPVPLIPQFPTADPHIAGVWWDNAGTLTKSAG